ncbi:MAG: hypothetical protein GWP17_03455 [Aquificales bacterium]|nr:hypothetical protein [Aquificales bacterium]
MSVATIQIQLDNKTAQAYQSTPKDRRERLQKLIGVMLQEFTETTPHSLLLLMDDMSREAKATGLTPEILGTFATEFGEVA